MKRGALSIRYLILLILGLIVLIIVAIYLMKGSTFFGGEISGIYEGIGFKESVKEVLK